RRPPLSTILAPFGHLRLGPKRCNSLCPCRRAALRPQPSRSPHGGRAPRPSTRPVQPLHPATREWPEPSVGGEVQRHRPSCLPLPDQAAPSPPEPAVQT